MSLRSGLLPGLGLLAAALALPAYAQASKPEDHPECANGAAMELAKQHELASRHWLACAQVADQTPYMTAKARIGRFQALEALGKRAVAEAELVTLTSKPVSDFKVFTRDASLPGSYLSAVTKTSVGVTQHRLIAVLASYRLAAEDKAGAVAIAERAMRAAPRDPASEAEISGAYVVRGKARFLNQDQPGAISDIVAAYLRGSEDSWVKGQVDGFPAEAKARLADLRKLMLEQAGAYAGATTAAGILATPEDKRQEIVTKALSTLPYIEAQETEMTGPRKWDTPK